MWPKYLLSEENKLVTPRFCLTSVILLLILLLAAFLRLNKLGQISPPGLNQDEAANAWSAYCLLKTGKDYSGDLWPIFYVRNVGGNSSPLYVYMILPFQALAGLSVYTTRLPAALAAVFNTWLIYFVAKRLFNIPTALVAAALLAIDPWDIQHSRWGHDASVTPFLSLVPLALMLWAALPVSDNKSASPKPVIAVLAGALAGIVCYGYYAVRLFVPVFLLLVILFTFPRWWQTVKSKKGALAVTGFFIAFIASYGPLIWQHVFHPEGVARHFAFSPDRINNVPFLDAVKNIALRYILHFSPYFLFIEGDSHAVLSPPGIGQFYWYMLPLMLAGFVFLIRRFKSSPSARIILAFVLAYPAGDCLIWGVGLSILRSAPGLCGLLLLSAVGAVDAFWWMWSKNRNAALIATAILAVAVVGFNGRYLNYFFGQFNRRPDVYHYFHCDFVEACHWLKPRFDDYDAVFCTVNVLNMPYVISTVVLGYDPKRWFSEPRDFFTVGEWDYCTRYGKMYFMYEGLFKLPAEPYNPDRLLFIIRPGELNIADPSRQVIHKILRPDGEEVLWLCRL